jgi:hypothetical protein
MELAGVTLTRPAFQYVKKNTYIPFGPPCHTPVLLHWTDSVLDEGAPFGNLNFVPFRP